MSLTLLVENNSKIVGFYKLNLFTWLGLETLVAPDATAAMKVLGGGNAQQIKLIIARAQINGEKTASDIIHFLQEKSIKIPVIVIGPSKEIPGSFAHMKNSLQLKTMIQGAAKALGITAQSMLQKEVPAYFPIPIQFFTYLRRPVCHVYAKDSGGNYILKFEKQKDISEDEMSRLEQVGDKNLYVDKMDRLELVNTITNEIMSTLTDNELSEDEQLTATDAVVEIASKKLVSLGINEETILLSKKAMEAMKKNTKNNPRLSKLLERLLANKASYLFTHTQLLSYIGLHIVKNIDWGNPEQEEKICFIAFFHDIALGNDEHGKIKSTLELKRSKFTEQEKSFIERHAQLAAELVSSFPHAPMGADQIIRQHHGMLNGVGYAEHFGNNVSPMSIVFIVAEEFTRIVLKHADGELNRTEMLRELKEVFPTSRFQKVIELLQTVTF